MMPASRTPECPAPETLAAFAEGKLKRAEIAPLLAHLERCPYCMSAVASASHAAGRTPSAGMKWLAAGIAAAVLLAIPFVRMRRTSGGSPMAQLIDSVPRDERLVEPRLTGNFPYAPFRGPERGASSPSDSARMKRIGIAGELTERADHDSTAASERDAAIALLLVEQPLQAAGRLRTATQRDPRNAQSWSDLSAALYAAARQLDRPSLYPQALDAADRALRIAPDSAEALFNRALILERLGVSPAARDAWQRYLQADPSSPWTAEARRRLAKLSAPTSSSLFDRDRSRLEGAAEHAETATVRELVVRYPQQARTWSELEYLSRWAAAAKSGDRASADRALATARSIGDALVQHSGESLLHDAVTAIAAVAPEDGGAREALIEGQLLYKQGRIAYSRQQLREADDALREAAVRLASARSPMALLARYFAANTRFDRNDVAGARAELVPLLREADALPRYAALGAQIRWELALCLMYDGDWPAARDQLTVAQSTFERLGERNNLGFIHGLLATTQLSCGNSDEAWASRIRAFEILSSEAQGDRLAVSVAGAARMETRAGRYEPARALLAVEDLLDREAKNDAMRANVLLRRAVIAAALGDDEATVHAREARAIGARIADPALRAMSDAHADFAEGAASVTADPHHAAETLTRAIDFYQRSASPAFLPEAYLMRARAAIETGDRAAALGDVEHGIAAAELHPIALAGGVRGAGVLDAGPALLLESIRLRLDGNDPDGAFASAQRFNAQLAPVEHDVVSIAELQRRLAGSDAAILSIAVLPRELVAFAISAKDRGITRTPVDELRVRTLAAAFASGDTKAARELYELLIRPSQRILSAARSLILVVPPSLEALPFAALHDASADRFLVESWSIAVAPSAGALRLAAHGAPRSAVAIALAAPSGNVALPESVSEAAEVSRLYPEGRELAGGRETFERFAAAARSVDVVHVASHTERNETTDEFAFTFDGERASWRTIAAMNLSPNATVLLSACDTLRRFDAPDARTLSLGAGFLAAGAADVVGTLTPIRDSDARQLFLEIHRHLAAGANAADALRAAQLAAIAGDRSTGRRGAWRALALLTRRIPERRGS